MRSYVSLAVATCSVAMALIAIMQGAQAHAVIIESVPAVGSVIAPGGFNAVLRYNSRIDHRRSRLTLVSPEGESTPLEIAQDSAPDLLMSPLSDLAPGQYRIRWQVLAIDGHLTRGDIPFSVKAP